MMKWSATASALLLMLAMLKSTWAARWSSSVRAIIEPSAGSKTLLGERRVRAVDMGSMLDWCPFHLAGLAEIVVHVLAGIAEAVGYFGGGAAPRPPELPERSEEHTSE